MRWILRFCGYVLLLIGLGCLGIFFYTNINRDVYQHREEAALNHPPSARPEAARPAHTPAPKPAETGGAIGRILIPRLGIRAIIDDGVDEKTLSRAVGHIPGTAYPGQSGNVALAGHRDTFFRDLRHLETNDEIDLETGTRKIRYRVDSIVVVEPSDTRVIAASSKDVLTLVTCFPFHYIGSAPRRFVVRASEID